MSAIVIPDPSAAPDWLSFCNRIHRIVPKDGRRKMVIDCDAGVDDIDAIMQVLNDPNVDVVAITCVSGNTACHQVVRNVRRTLALCNRQDIPIFAGATSPLVEPPRDAGYFHGSDGIGGLDSEDLAKAAEQAAGKGGDSSVPDFEKDWPPLQSETAVHALIRLAYEYLLPEDQLIHPLQEGDTLEAQAARLNAMAEVQLKTAAQCAKDGAFPEAHVRRIDVSRLQQRASAFTAALARKNNKRVAPVLEILSLAPVTNLALAARVDPGFAGAVKAVFAMVGADKARGNHPLMPAVEFNAHADPEALAVFVSMFEQAALIPWDCCLTHSWPWDEVTAWQSSETPRGRFAKRISRPIFEYFQSKGALYVTADPLAAAIALHPTSVVEAPSVKHRHVGINLQPGSTTHGMTIVDHEGISCQVAATWVVETLRHEVLTKLLPVAYMDQTEAAAALRKIFVNTAGSE